MALSAESEYAKDEVKPIQSQESPRTDMDQPVRMHKWQGYLQEAGTLPVDVVAIETVGNCNRACGYCPVSVAPKRTGRLPDKVIYRIFDELGALGFRGKLTYHFYNEPMLDTRMPDLVAYSALKVPLATRHLTSNGDLLDEDKLRMLFDKGASVIAISAHDNATYERFIAIKQRLGSGLKLRIRPYFKVGDGSGAARITNRAGAIDLSAYAAEESVEAGPEGCNRVELNIDYLGNVHPCCMDFTAGYVLGNVFDASLADLWAQALPQFKEHFFGNYSKEVCRKCAKIA